MAPERDEIEELLKGLNLRKKRKYIAGVIVALAAIAGQTFYLSQQLKYDASKGDLMRGG